MEDEFPDYPEMCTDSRSKIAYEIYTTERTYVKSLFIAISVGAQQAIVFGVRNFAPCAYFSPASTALLVSHALG